MDKAHPSSVDPTPQASAEPSFSTFDRALEEYLGGLPKDKKKFKFIELCGNSGINATPNAINTLLQRKEAQSALSGPVHRIFSLVMRALERYSDVIGQLVSAQPLPCAIIWGALKVVIEASSRCDIMFESMQKELLSLAEYLQRMTVYEDLYGDSKAMQRLLFASYTNIIHFWHRVHKECKPGPGKIIRALKPSPLKKMNEIISEIHSISDSIFTQALLCQGQSDKLEYTEACIERKLQTEWRERQNVANYFDVCTQIRDHLAPSDDVTRPNSYFHESNLRSMQPETCQWLTEEGSYASWCGPAGPVPRLFCLSGPPGYGKSTLTSFAIRQLESKGAAVAYYFCQFSQKCEDPTQILRLIALQLFNIYFERQLPLDHDFSQCILQSRKPEDFQDRIGDLVTRLLYRGGVYFFVDGLDEAAHNGISSVLAFLNCLRKDWADYQVGLWITKRRQNRVIECFEKHIQPELRFTVELSDHTEADVVRFLRANMLSLKQRFFSQQGCNFSEKDSALLQAAEQYLIVRAQGNFLWARLMTQDFDGENRVEDVKELLEHILGNTPKELSDLYETHFLRFKRMGRDNERVAVKVMSLIAFSRRHLRLEEIQEASETLLNHGKKKNTLISAMSLKMFLAKYTTLVEVDGNPADPAPTDTCRLVHSSVFEFLDENPAILDKDLKDRQLHFSRFALANACLVYLSRPVFSKLLQKQSFPDMACKWVDGAGDPVDKHVFSQYAAKYWVRHVEDLIQQEQDQIRSRVVSFVSSNNFQTCMQIQSIWVQGRFDEYLVGGRLSLLRAMPDWLIRSRFQDTKRLTITNYWWDYRELLHDWRTLLSCGSCHDTNPDCSYLMLRGETDRIWWTALGPDHLFCTFQSRYKSFRLAEGKNISSECFEALNISKEQIILVRLETWDRPNGFLKFICEHWTILDHVSPPTLAKKQVITTTEAQTNWLLYSKPPSEGLTRLVARPSALSHDAKILRLGSQIFRKEDDNEYYAVPNADSRAYYEEVSGTGSLVAIGSRSHVLAEQLQEPFYLLENFGRDFTRIEQSEAPGGIKDSLYTTCIESDDEWLSEESSNSSDMEMEAYESWSEGSTDNEDCAYSDSSSESDVDESQTSDLETGTEESDEDSHAVSSSSDDKSDIQDARSASGNDTPSVLSPSAFPSLNGMRTSVSEEEIWGMEVDALLGTFTREPNTREPTALLTVLQCKGNAAPSKLFEYSCPVRLMLYDSPPAIHPHESLVVWPLGGGDLLFADVNAKTYFTRQLHPSAPHTRQILVKAQFSHCGHFLHVASLEARVQPAEGDRRCKNKQCLTHHPLPDLHLYLLVLTYRLSSRKPTRSPPVLLRRIKVDLGKHEGLLNISRLPFVFTWTLSDLFVSRRGVYLDVFRIQLFNNEKTSNGCPSEQSHNVLVPQKKILLPNSATLRDVYFVPLCDDANGASMVVVGRETRAKAVLLENFSQPGVSDALESEAESNMQKKRTLAPSIGAILQLEDLGGWVQAEGIVAPQGRFMGYLDIRKEKFDPVDDCSAEPY